MDLLLIVLGLFGLIPIATMSFFYGVLPVLLVGLQVLGAIEGLRAVAAPEPAGDPAPCPTPADHAIPT